MEKKDLMIGDWVQNPLGWKAQVQSIRYVNTIKDEWEWLVKIGINNETFQDHLSLNEIGAIPLTAEILEKNGFESTPAPSERVWMRNGQEVWLDNEGKNYWANIKNGEFYFEGYIEFVHELQHCLKLVEIEKSIEL